MNDGGDAVGLVQDLDASPDYNFATLWRGGQRYDLSGIAARRGYTGPSQANGINVAGRIVGGVGSRAVVWDGCGIDARGQFDCAEVTDLGPGLAVAVSDAGEVVIVDAYPAESGRVVDPFSGHTRSWINAWPGGINVDGDVVLTRRHPPSTDTSISILHKDGSETPLQCPTASCSSLSAVVGERAINDSGTVLGKAWGYDAPGSSTTASSDGQLIWLPNGEVQRVPATAGVSPVNPLLPIYTGFEFVGIANSGKLYGIGRSYFPLGPRRAIVLKPLSN